MNLETFASQVLRTNVPNQRNTRSTVRDILPPQQRTRSYKDLETANPKFEPILIQYSIGEHRNEWMLRYRIQIPMGIERRDVTKRQIDDFAKEYLKIHSYRGDEKYVSIARADINEIWFQFDVVKWLNDNFRTVRPRYNPPLSFEFRYRNSIPSMIFIRSVSTDLTSFIEKRFQDWMRLNIRKVRHDSFSFLRRITPELFNYELDTQGAKMKMSLKYSVVLGSLALYTAHRHERELSRQEVNRISSRVRGLGDVKRLDRYLKNL